MRHLFPPHFVRRLAWRAAKMLSLRRHLIRIFGRRFISPLIPITLAYICGIVAQGSLHVSALTLAIFLAATLALGLIYLRTPTACVGLLTVAFFFAGALRVEVASQLPGRHIGRMTPTTGQWVRLEGVVVSEPREARYHTTFDLRVERGWQKKGEPVALCGLVLVRDYHKTDVALGERLLLTGKLFKPRGPFVQGLAQRGVYSILSVSKRGQVKKEGRGLWFWSPLLVRQRLAKVFSAQFDPVTASLMRAMVLGEKTIVPQKIKNAMIVAGTWHLMVVSGSHTVFVAGMVLMFLKILRVPGKARLWASMAAVVAFCLLTGVAVSVVRATVMTVAFLYTFVRERHPLIWHSLALSALAILLWDPSALTSVSFLLSFLSVMSIVWLAPRLDPTAWLERRWRPSDPLFRVLRPLMMLMVVSLSAWLGTAPLTAACFGTVSLYAVVSNMAAVPLSAGIIGSGCLALCLGLFSYRLAEPVAAACSLLFTGLVALNAWIASWPMAQVRLSLPGGVGLFGIYGALVLVLSRLPGRQAEEEEGRE